jgi:hypothetical protein
LREDIDDDHHHRNHQYDDDFAAHDDFFSASSIVCVFVLETSIFVNLIVDGHHGVTLFTIIGQSYKYY